MQTRLLDIDIDWPTATRTRTAQTRKMSQLPQRFFTTSGLKSRSDETRLKAAHDLQKFVSTELRELPAEQYSSTLDEINSNIFSLVSSPEIHEKKGGIFAIGKESHYNSA